METLMGVVLGGALGYMLGDQKDAKKVAGREVWAAAGAMAGHLVQGQLTEGVQGSAPPQALTEEVAQLRRSNTELRKQHQRHLMAIDSEVDDLIAIYEGQAEAAATEEAARPRRVVRVGSAPQRSQRTAPPQHSVAPEVTPPRRAPAPRRPAALPDYSALEIPEDQRTREYAYADRDAEDVFGS